MSNKEIGKYGENLAKEYLIKKGYEIIETNYRYSRYGEIDIIALYKKELCFVEVKARKNDKFGTPMEAVTKNKLSKILSCIKNYISENKNLYFEKYGIDVISIEINDNMPKITHFKNIGF